MKEKKQLEDNIICVKTNLELSCMRLLLLVSFFYSFLPVCNNLCAKILFYILQSSIYLIQKNKPCVDNYSP